MAAGNTSSFGIRYYLGLKNLLGEMNSDVGGIDAGRGTVGFLLQGKSSRNGAMSESKKQLVVLTFGCRGGPAYRA